MWVSSCTGAPQLAHTYFLPEDSLQNVYREYKIAYEDSKLGSILKLLQSYHVNLNKYHQALQWLLKGGKMRQTMNTWDHCSTGKGWGQLFAGDSHFLDKSGFRVRKDVALIPAQSTAWTIEVDSQVSVISFHRHTYVLFKEREKS